MLVADGDRGGRGFKNFNASPDRRKTTEGFCASAAVGAAESYGSWGGGHLRPSRHSLSLSFLAAGGAFDSGQMDGMGADGKDAYLIRREAFPSLS